MAAVVAVVTISACTSSPAPSGPSDTSNASASPQAAPKLTPYTSADFATALAWAPDGRLFYAERSGTIRSFDGPRPGLFATISTSTDGERGPLGLGPSPTSRDDPFVYPFSSRAAAPTRQRVV